MSFVPIVLIVLSVCIVLNAVGPRRIFTSTYLNG
jgi:hypothetical protein